jgi:hypothetical protein
MGLDELFLLVILLILLFKEHEQRKGTGQYGKLYNFLKKRVVRYLLRKFAGLFRSNI